MVLANPGSPGKMAVKMDEGMLSFDNITLLNTTMQIVADFANFH